MKMIAPNIARPITKPSEEATLNTGERNSFSGMIGSAARRSCQTNAPSSTTPATPARRSSASPSAYSLPPQVVTRISALRPRSAAWRRGSRSVAMRGHVQVQPEDDDSTATCRSAC